jgi:hypothetical protein
MSNISYVTAQVFSAFDGLGNATNMSMTPAGDFEIVLPTNDSVLISAGHLKLYGANDTFEIQLQHSTTSALNIWANSINLQASGVGGGYLLNGVALADASNLEQSISVPHVGTFTAPPVQIDSKGNLNVSNALVIVSPSDTKSHKCL